MSAAQARIHTPIAACLRSAAAHHQPHAFGTGFATLSKGPQRRDATLAPCCPSGP